MQRSAISDRPYGAQTKLPEEFSRPGEMVFEFHRVNKKAQNRKLKRSKLALFEFNAHGLTGTANIHFSDTKI